MAIRCIVIDDEPLAINVLKNYIAQTKGLELLSTFSNALDSIEFMRNNEVDLIFLDINMPVLDGLNFLKSINVKPFVVITTAYEEHAVESYELEVLDYLVKPIPFHRFVMAVNKAFRMQAIQQKSDLSDIGERKFIFVKVDKKKMKKVFLDEITVIESLKDYIKINTYSGKYIVHQTLGSFTDELPADKFIRIHRSYTVSLNKIEALEGNSIEIGGYRYTIGRSYFNEVRSKILNKPLEDDDL
ncbi:LytR/AlgR family response regulator transcription factor [Sinomicrobium weinanense]|uniref:Response regulator transcription factor n=1 Tax=Sinomicrobium weinanense TaxID=2842200 RepID=A0A926JUY1_9FLAO|nr:response regulator transcription factor [Sinomicrobium weinanense]MBC9797839.1 response regulator transcription factor [Sinomicrobium weinanense]MBU3124674.1 response regulator transcription factor [Sinomicrobium weinanense]